MTAYAYDEDNLYTLACQLSRVVEQEGQESDYATKLSMALKAAYDNGVQLNVVQTLMLQAWKLVLLREFCNELGEEKLSELLTETKVKPFVDSIDALGIRQTLKGQLNYD